MPRTPRRIVALLLAGAAATAPLAACTPAASSPTESPSSSPVASGAPIFASDEEALAAAVAAYESYLSVSDTITADGGADPQRIRVATSASFAERSEEDFTSFQQAGLRTVGNTSIDTARLLELSIDDRAVSFYACQDVSSIRILNSEGDDVTPADRDERIPLVVETVRVGSALTVDGNQVWAGDDFC